MLNTFLTDLTMLPTCLATGWVILVPKKAFVNAPEQFRPIVCGEVMLSGWLNLPWLALLCSGLSLIAASVLAVDEHLKESRRMQSQLFGDSHAMSENDENMMPLFNNGETGPVPVHSFFGPDHPRRMEGAVSDGDELALEDLVQHLSWTSF